jgi:hypothetical protein
VESNSGGRTGTREMMRDVFERSILAATLIAVVTGLAPLAHADPPQCPATGCPHLPGNTSPPVNVPPPANVNSPSYKDGYKTEHDYFATPQNHAYLASEMKSGYTTELACQTELGGGPSPPSPSDWVSGCVEALHDLGFRP